LDVECALDEIFVVEGGVDDDVVEGVGEVADLIEEEGGGDSGAEFGGGVGGEVVAEECDE
jgi:hypothetical protein